MVLSYLSYREAENRAYVLAQGSSSSLGLLMSTGDLFQIKNFLKSFATHETVSVHLFDESGKILSLASQGKQEAPNLKRRFQFRDWQVLLWTKHPVVFNNIHYGDLAFLNVIQIRGWLVISLFLLSTNTIFFLWQNSSLKKLSLRIGKSVIEVVKIFETSSKIGQESSQRQRTTFYEIEQLAENVLDAMNRIQITNSLEKEAAIGRITAHLSHDMRAPLGAIERLMLASENEISSMKGAVQDSLNRLYSMIEALRHTESETLVHRTLAQLEFGFVENSLKYKALSKGILLDIPKNKFGELLIDSLKLERAWINLTSNAMEVAKSFVKIEADFKGDHLFIRVIDDGPGVPGEILPKLFQRGVTHGKADGTGLGLAYVRQIMRGHGGDVTYRRENGRTVFECFLPRAIESEKEQVMNNTATLDFRLVQKMVRNVAICLEPESLSKSVLSKVSSFKTDEFLFSEERNGAHVVVSNIDEIMFAVLEGDEQEFVHVSSAWGDEEGILARLKLKFDIS